ncbi:MAG: serine/threonine protein kinase [Deltaproteobacteria bacterium]|nr:serine/threonine protein kinase [Deltaproteobacteria bacterium]
MGNVNIPPQAYRLIARAFTRDMIVSELEQAGLDIPQDDKEVIGIWVQHLAHVFDPTDNPFSLDSLLMGLTAGGIGFLQDNGLLSDALKRALLLNVLVLDTNSLMQALLARVLRETPTVANVIEGASFDDLKDVIDKELVKIVFIDAYRYEVDVVAKLYKELSESRDYLQFVLFSDIKRLLESCPTLPTSLENCVVLDKNTAIKDFKPAVYGAIEAVRARFPGLLRDSRPDAKDLVGRIVGNRLRVIEVIGRGGQATIYRADHLMMNRQCALKVAYDEVMRDPDASGRFLREAKLASAVQHPNIVSVFDFGTDDNGTTFMAMELVDGKPLDIVLEEQGGTLPLEDVLEYARGVAAGLTAIHAMGLVHRDIKPGNVLLHNMPDGRVIPKLSDFGFAIGPEMIGGARFTMDGIVVGTVKYLSPEQGQAKEVDHRTDIFSLGMMLYRLLVARVPFEDENVAQALYKRVKDQAPPIREFDSDLPINDEAEQLLLSMLEKNPDDRPDAAMAIIAAMDKALGFERKF